MDAAQDDQLLLISRISGQCCGSPESLVAAVNGDRPPELKSGKTAGELHFGTPKFSLRFLKVGYENVVGQFNKLTQRGMVEDYITQFDELRNYVMAEEGFHRESYYIDNFISGLKDDIAQYLYNQRPQTMQEARDMARGQEFFLSVLDKRFKTVGAQNKGSFKGHL
ncbi:hypothetical protein AgCh_034538 [Apium graveolens]